MKNNTIDERMLSAQVSIDNALSNADIKEAMALFGYDEPKLLEGKALLDDALSKHSIQKKEYGEQYEATDSLDVALTEANLNYMRHIKVARVALKADRGAAQSLDLDGRRKQSYSGWISQARLFYTNAAADKSISNELAKFGINSKALKTGLTTVGVVEDLLATQLKEKGEAQEATKVRDDAFDLLYEWVGDFKTIAKIALEDQSQKLEMLGITSK